ARNPADDACRLEQREWPRLRDAAYTQSQPFWATPATSSERCVPDRFALSIPRGLQDSLVAHSFWRRRRDSNPRYAFAAYNGLAILPHQCHVIPCSGCYVDMVAFFRP